MAYRIDPDLEFLSECKSEDLDDLVYCLTHDPKDNKKRYTQTLMSKERYKKYNPDHQKYWKLIAEELQRFGANTLATFLVRKGYGVLYREILIDVCKKLKVNFNEYNFTTEKLEKELLNKIAEDAIEKMEPNEVEQLAKELGINYIGMTNKAMSTAVLTAFRKGGFKSYIVLRRIINQVVKIIFGKGLPPVVNALIGKVVKKAMPFMIVADGIWTVMEIASPATRVTIPAVIQVAILRQKHLLQGNEQIDTEKFDNLVDMMGNENSDIDSYYVYRKTFSEV